jgi:hypothetical protein
LAVLRVPVDRWEDLRSGVAALDAFVTPKDPD